MFLNALVVQALPENSVALSRSSISVRSRLSDDPNHPSFLGTSTFYSVWLTCLRASFLYLNPTEVRPEKQSPESSSLANLDNEACRIDVGKPRALQNSYGVSTSVDTLLQIMESRLQNGKVSFGSNDWSINAS